MFKQSVRTPPDEIDLEIFQMIPEDHHLRRALNCIDWESFQEKLAPHYSDMGRPGDGLLMLKLEYLQYHGLLSDRQIIDRARTDIAYRFFLGLGRNDALPDPSTLCYFRARLGVEGHQALFDAMVGQARGHGLVNDRLRLKDATHVIANVAVPTTLALLAQTRDQLLAAAEPFDPLRVEGERARVQSIRSSTKNHPDEQRLVVRIGHVREMLGWMDQLTPPANAQGNATWQRLVAARELAHKILGDQDNPQGGDRTRSTTDPDARRGKHGVYYDGYLLDILVDADSQLVTGLDVLVSNGDEAANAAKLVRQEQQTHGNDVEGFSIDGIGFNGPVLRELQDPQGLNLDVVVPPKESAGKTFEPQAFIEDADRGVVICPAGETSHYRHRDNQNRATVYRFARESCRGCPLLDQCMEKAPGKLGRTVRKNDYEAEHRRAREKAKTPHYEAVRREHPQVERKLSELVNRYGARHARYRGRLKVHCQQLMTATAANVNRMVRLLCAPTVAPATG
jgi:transposase